METFLFINHNERFCTICYKSVEDLYLSCIFRIAYFKKRDNLPNRKAKTKAKMGENDILFWVFLLYNDARVVGVRSTKQSVGINEWSV